MSFLTSEMQENVSNLKKFPHAVPAGTGKNISFVIFRPCGVKFLSPKFFNMPPKDFSTCPPHRLEILAQPPGGGGLTKPVSMTCREARREDGGNKV